MRKIGKTVCLQSVLVLSAAHAPANVEVLSSLHVQSGARNLRGRPANARDHLVNADLAFAKRLQLAKHACGAAAASATGEGSDGVNGRILQDDVRELAHFLGHG